MMLDARDTALQTLTPSVMVPKFSVMETLNEAGHRFLVASDGLWMEVKRAWLDLLVPLAQQYTVPLPYGNLEPTMAFKFGKLPITYLKDFVREARKQLPNECAAWIIWDEHTSEMRLEHLIANFADDGKIEYQCPDLDDGEHMVVDLHSHGYDKAFFSPQDNKDDMTTTKIACVVGNVANEIPSVRMRLCANGYFIKLPDIEIEV